MLIIFTTTGRATAAATFQYKRKRGEGEVGGILRVGFCGGDSASGALFLSEHFPERGTFAEEWHFLRWRSGTFHAGEEWHFPRWRRSGKPLVG